jgi:2-keto-3-deoxy-L-rhamnonate aldolase RhmA
VGGVDLLKPNSLKDRLRRGDVTIGAWMTLGTFDWEEHIRQGFRFAVLGSDISMIMRGLRDIPKRIGPA